MTSKMIVKATDLQARNFNKTIVICPNTIKKAIQDVAIVYWSLELKAGNKFDRCKSVKSMIQNVNDAGMRNCSQIKS